MRRRLLAATAALVLAVAGAVILVGYARGADARAMAGMQVASVLVVDKPIAEGTPGDQLKDLVRSELLPRKAVEPGRVTDLHQLSGKVAAIDLAPGEQLLASRFVAPSDLRAAGTVPAPKGDQEVSVLLEPQRAVGGRLAAGDKVGVYVSIKTPDGSGLTHAVLHGVLVTQVQGAPTPSGQTNTAASSSTSASASPAPTPTQSLLITLAVTAKEAEPIIFGQEHGTLWLSLEPDGADNGGTAVIGPNNVYTGAYQ